MVRRRNAVSHRGPGLAKTVARTAVISGTATAVSGAVANRQTQRNQDASLQQQIDQMQAQSVQEQMSHGASGAVSGEELISQLTRLGELHQQGVLTADEFAKAKARLLEA